MKAIILAGGKGTRLMPYTTLIPKPLVPIGEKAIIEILIGQLKKYDVDEVFICLNHFAEITKAYLGNGEKYGIKINYSLETKALGTVAPLKLIKNLTDSFLVMNGDLLTDLNFSELFQYHTTQKSELTISTYKRTSMIDFGVIETQEQSNVIAGFKEKPKYDFEVSMGVYAMNKSILSHIPDDTPFGFDNLIHLLLDKGVRMITYPYSGYWLDIGRPEDYEKANTELEFLNTIL